MSEDRTVEENDWFGLWIGKMAEEIDVAIRAQAADDLGARRGLDGQALGTRRDFAIVTNPDKVLLAPDKRPPRASRDWSQDGVLVGEGLLPGGVRGGAQCAVDFVLIDMREELIQEFVGPLEFQDVIGRQQGWETFLPVIVAAFDFAFGLGRWRIAQGDAVEVQGGPELGEGIGCVGEEKGVIIHIQCQWQAMGLKGAREKVQMGQQGFGGIKPRPNIVARGVIEQVEEGLFGGIVWQPGMGTGVILPEGAQIPHLPAFNGLGRDLVTGVGSQLILDGPAADTGAVGFKIEPAVEFAGTSAVGGRGFGREQLLKQVTRGGRPGGLMISAGDAGRPGLGLTLGTGPEVLAVEFVEARAGQA